MKYSEEDPNKPWYTITGGESREYRASRLGRLATDDMDTQFASQIGFLRKFKEVDWSLIEKINRYGWWMQDGHINVEPTQNTSGYELKADTRWIMSLDPQKAYEEISCLVVAAKITGEI